MGFKICFIWIDKFRNFEKFGFNLDSSIKFNFDYEKYELSKVEPENSINNFFGSDISEVTGVIGKNGTGKSNLLELVCKLVKGGKTSVDSDFLIITKNKGQFECHHRFRNDKNFVADFDIIFKKYSGDIDNLKTIYFSNVYDERIHSFSSKISDLSANKRYRRHSWPSRKTSDFVKQLQFVKSDLFSHSEIPIPKEVIITTKLNTYNSSFWERGFQPVFLGGLKLKDELRSFFEDMKNLKPTQNKLYYFSLFIIILEIIDFVRDSAIDYKIEVDSIDYSTKILLEDIDQIKLTYKSKVDISAKWEKWCGEIIDIVSRDHFTFEIKKSKTKSSLNNLKSNYRLLKNYDSFINSKNLKFNTEGSYSSKTESYILKFDASSNKMDEHFYNFMDQSSKFKLDWLGLSSGQKAYLDVFSLLRFELKNIKSDNVLICIDEGDLYLHPKWQADFFYKLVELVPQFKLATYQFVLSSHSPFLVSDLPKNNLTFLGDNSENYSQAIYQNDNIQTFGGNLGELYINAFFMEGSLISRFAASKIQNLVNKVNSKEQLNNDDEKLINSIGDDIIRVQLQKLRNDKN